MLACVLAQVVAGTAERAARIVPSEHEVAIVDAHVEHVAFADAQCVPEVGREHNPAQRVDSACSVGCAHVIEAPRGAFTVGR